MTSSILDDIKHTLGILPEETAFDIDILLFVNGVFGTLTQLGVGPTIGYQIDSKDNTWAEYFTDARLNAVKTYIFLCVKMNFDPPTSAAMMDAMARQKTEAEFRLNLVAEYG